MRWARPADHYGLAASIRQQRAAVLEAPYAARWNASFAPTTASSVATAAPR